MSITALSGLFAPLFTAATPEARPLESRRTYQLPDAPRGRMKRSRHKAKVPRVDGIAHPPTARLRACGSWGRRP